jgi:hypothetical protein
LSRLDSFTQNHCGTTEVIFDPQQHLTIQLTRCAADEWLPRGQNRQPNRASKVIVSFGCPGATDSSPHTAKFDVGKMGISS